MHHVATEPAATVTVLFHYPVKSCAGTPLDRLAIDARGPRYDREFMIVDANTGEGLTQRRFPQMALIQPTVREKTLHLAAPSIAPVETPISLSGEECSVSVWKDDCRAIDHGPAIAAWCSNVLQTPCRLVRMHGAEPRALCRPGSRDERSRSCPIP